MNVTFRHLEASNYKNVTKQTSQHEKIILSAIIAIGAGAVCFAASPKVKYGVNATNITSIESSAAVKVVYTPSGSTSVTVTTPKELQEYLSVKVSGDKLKIGRKTASRALSKACRMSL